MLTVVHNRTEWDSRSIEGLVVPDRKLSLRVQPGPVLLGRSNNSAIVRVKHDQDWRIWVCRKTNSLPEHALTVLLASPQDVRDFYLRRGVLDPLEALADVTGDLWERTCNLFTQAVLALFYEEISKTLPPKGEQRPLRVGNVPDKALPVDVHKVRSRLSMQIQTAEQDVLPKLRRRLAREEELLEKRRAKLIRLGG